jgi:hypothetical protein
MITVDNVVDAVVFFWSAKLLNDVNLLMLTISFCLMSLRRINRNLETRLLGTTGDGSFWTLAIKL